MDLTTLIWKQKNHTPSITGTLNCKDYSIIMSSKWNRCAERWQLWNFYFWRLLVDSKVRLLNTEKERFKLWSSNHSKSPNENDFIGHPGLIRIFELILVFVEPELCHRISSVHEIVWNERFIVVWFNVRNRKRYFCFNFSFKLQVYCS